MFYRNWIFSTALSHVFFHFKVIRDIYKPYFTDIIKYFRYLNHFIYKILKKYIKKAVLTGPKLSNFIA